jgi:RimJ/RimL family protein N-acetyltransferase
MPVHACELAALDVALGTARLCLEPLRPGHADALFEPLLDERAYRWISVARSASVEALRARWGRLRREGDVLDLGWAVRRTSDGAWIGKMDAEVRHDGVATNVGYLFFAPYWGQGYATEAVQALAGHLARQGVVEQHATVTAGNAASCRVLERAGFVFERVIPANDVIDGQPVDDLEYVRREAGAARPRRDFPPA